MLNEEEVKQAMYQIFNESDALRDEFCKELDAICRETRATEGLVINVYGRLLIRRLFQASSVEELRGYTTELVTLLAILRLTLDQAIGIQYGAHQTEERPTTPAVP